MLPSGNERAEIPDMFRMPWPGSSLARELASDAHVLLTVWLHPKPGGELDVAAAVKLGSTLPRARTYAERKELRSRTDADPASVKRLTTYFEEFGIRVVGSHWRSLVISGPLDRLVEAFGATVSIFADAEGRHFRHRSKGLHVPQDIAHMMRGVFGLHQWPPSRKLGSLSRHATPLSAADVVKRYDFPLTDATDQTIGIVQFRGGFKPDDFDCSMKAQNITRAHPIVKRVDGAAVAHTIETTKDLEAALDAQVIGALAPGARIVIYDAPDDERGFLDAIRTALFDEEDQPSILSISYGWPEQLWTPAALAVLDDLFIVAALLGVSVFCSSGDNGAELDLDGKPHVLAPASSPFVHACGATAIASTPENADDREDAWERSGGGFSERAELPPWQDAAKHVAARYRIAAGRGVPDISAQQDPGYCVFLNGVELAMGGTSAVAPLWAALTARINERLGVSVGHFAPILYASRDGIMRDVTSGTNGRFHAHAGWNPCTGLGVPVGTRIEAALRGKSPVR